jgi:hypothetical protein
MRLFKAATFSVFFALAACGQAAAPGVADAQTAEISAAERTAILSALEMSANASGQVENECGERVTPQYVPTDLGAGVGRAVALVMTGGPNFASCYGDGPLVLLMHEKNGAWRNVYMNRGGPMVILSTTHHDANDLADGGPGFSFPVWEWNGNEYVSANRDVADSALGDARYVPN